MMGNKSNPEMFYWGLSQPGAGENGAHRRLNHDIMVQLRAP